MDWLGGVTITALALAILFVCARVYTRGLVTRSLGVDDLFLVVVLAVAIFHQVGTMFQISKGLGNPSALTNNPSSSSNSQALAKWLFATTTAYEVSHALLNLSVAFQYKRLFTSSPRLVIRALLGWIIFSGSSTVLLSPFRCTPPSDFWNDLNDQAGCLARSGISIFLAAVAVVNDLLLWGFPFVFLAFGHWHWHWSMGPGMGKMIGVCAVLVLGFCAVACSGIRLYAYVKSGELVFASTLGSSYPVMITLTGSLEICLGIIAASLATLGPLADLLKGALRVSVPVRVGGRRASLANRNTPSARGYRRQTSTQDPRARAFQSGESILLDDYPRTRTAASGGSPLSLPMPAPRVGPSSLGAGAGAGAGPIAVAPALAPGSGGNLRQRRSSGSSSSGPSSVPALPASAFGACPGILVTTTIDVAFSPMEEDVRLERDEDGAPSIPGTIASCSAEGHQPGKK